MLSINSVIFVTYLWNDLYLTIGEEFSCLFRSFGDLDSQRFPPNLGKRIFISQKIMQLIRQMRNVAAHSNKLIVQLFASLVFVYVCVCVWFNWLGIVPIMTGKTNWTFSWLDNYYLLLHSVYVNVTNVCDHRPCTSINLNCHNRFYCHEPLKLICGYCGHHFLGFSIHWLVIVVVLAWPNIQIDDSHHSLTTSTIAINNDSWPILLDYYYSIVYCGGSNENQLDRGL